MTRQLASTGRQVSIILEGRQRTFKQSSCSSSKNMDSFSSHRQTSRALLRVLRSAETAVVATLAAPVSGRPAVDQYGCHHWKLGNHKGRLHPAGKVWSSDQQAHSRNDELRGQADEFRTRRQSSTPRADIMPSPAYWSEWVLDKQEDCDAHVKKAFEHGIQTFDTANMYSNGQSEVMLGKSLKALGVPRADVVILTKVYMPVKAGSIGGDRPPQSQEDLDAAGYINQRGLSRKHIFDSVQDSLKRLDTEYIDLLQCHRFDYNTPIEETMTALHDVVQKGWVRYIGMSSCFAHQFWQMQSYAIHNKLTPFISMQNFVNAAYREEEREMVPTLKHFGVGCIPWSPIARGYLARPAGDMGSTTRGDTDQMTKKYFGSPSPSAAEINKRIEKVAKDIGKSMAQVAYAWCSAQDYVDAPIIGSTKLDHLVEAIESVQVKLTKEQLDYISEPYVPQAIMGHA